MGDMSTLAGANIWEDDGDRDTGPAEPALAQPVQMPPDEEEFLPADPRPDRSGEADEADVAEQALEVPEDEGEHDR
jgi:hypothetical protein